MLHTPDGISRDAAADRKMILWSMDDRRQIRIVREEGDVHVLQPHAILRKSDGSELLQAYQVEGDHEGRSEQGWRHFDLASISHVELLTDKFLPRRDFRPVSGEQGLVVAQVWGSEPAAS